MKLITVSLPSAYHIVIWHKLDKSFQWEELGKFGHFWKTYPFLEREHSCTPLCTNSFVAASVHRGNFVVNVNSSCGTLNGARLIKLQEAPANEIKFHWCNLDKVFVGGYMLWASGTVTEIWAWDIRLEQPISLQRVDNWMLIVITSALTLFSLLILKSFTF